MFSEISYVWDDDITIVIINMIVTRKLLTNIFLKPRCVVWRFCCRESYDVARKNSHWNLFCLHSYWYFHLLGGEQILVWLDLFRHGPEGKLGHDPYCNWQLEHTQIMFHPLNERDVAAKITHGILMIQVLYSICIG